jgi:hypothetical protein
MSPLTRVNNEALQAKIDQMRLTIAPIVSVATSLPPKDFPPTILSLFLLTEDQLDYMAHYYSQSTPNSLTHKYPMTMDWQRPLLQRPQPGDAEGERLTDYERLKVKMRMFARFIGMRGAETPGWEYERQMEILGRRIERVVEEEERAKGSGEKWYRGPPTLR